MSSVKRAAAASFLSFLARGSGIAALALTAGCSADATRFDLLGETQFASGSLGYTPPRRQASSRAASTGLQETSLPPARQASGAHRVARDYPPPTQAYHPPGRPPERAARARADRAPPVWSWADRPPPRWSGKPLWTDAEPFPWPDSQPPPRQAAPAPAHRPSFQGHYTMRRGDTLPRIAQRYKVSLNELKRVNGIADTDAVRAGTVLAIPARNGAGHAAAPAAPRVVQVTPRTVGGPPRADASPAPQPARKAALRQHGTATEALPQPEVGGGRFRWPVRGKVIARFGARPDGSKGDGIKLAAPIGTDIHAAEAGRVHYAGDGLKGYGNLILVRHANGWVSTYAHADKMLVKVGDEVRRGQVIGTVGRTGPVAHPQLGFELRKGSVPVDPLPHLGS